MPSLITDAIPFLLQQQHQFTLCLVSKAHQQFFVPTILNDNLIDERIALFYFNKICPRSTIMYLNRLRLRLKNHVVDPALLVGRKRAPTSHRSQIVNSFEDRFSSQDDEEAISIESLAIKGHLRRLILDATSLVHWFGRPVGASSRPVQHERLVLRTSLFDNVVLKHRIDLVELRFCAIHFSSPTEAGEMISILADDRAITRKSLTILEISDCHCFRSSSDEDSNAKNKSSTHHEEHCLFPGMKHADDLTKLTALEEIRFVNNDFGDDDENKFYFCFEFLPSHNLQSLDISKNPQIRLHPAYASADHGGVDWENMPSTLRFLSIHHNPSQLFTANKSCLSTTSGTTDVNDETTTTRISYIRKFPIFPLNHLSPRLEILNASSLEERSFIPGPLLPAKMNSCPNLRNLKQLLLLSCRDLEGPFDFASLPPNLEVLSLVFCSRLGSAEKYREYQKREILSSNETEVNKETDDHKESSYDIVDLSNLPRCMRTLRLDGCNLRAKNIDITNLPVTMECLMLSHNAFEGPLDFSQLAKNQSLTSIDVSTNRFEGVVDLRNIPDSLQYVNLSLNRFNDLRMNKKDLEEKRGLKVNSRGNESSVLHE